MFSALKRLTGKADGGGNAVTGTPCPRPGLQAMSHSLQRKFARGVQYNMKIIIKGDRNVGKTCLFHRLQGGKFVEEYIPTEEIQVASIQWSYKATEDVVKVEVWDVVDHGRKRRQLKGLKLGPDCATEDGGKEGVAEDGPEEAALDAQFLDVYKGTNGVVLMMDVTKSWTFDYVVRELPKVPHHIPVLVLANHCDMGHHRTVTSDTVTYFIEGLNRSPGSIVRYAESSMRNGFGLRLLHRFLNVPFLRLQRDTLEAQLATNARETELTIAELDLYQSSDEADYDKFLENLTSRRRAAAENTGAQGQAFSSYAPTPVGPNGSMAPPTSAGPLPQAPPPSLNPSQSSHALSSPPNAPPPQTWNQGQMPRPEPLGAMKKSSSFPAVQSSSITATAANSNAAPPANLPETRPATGPGKQEPKPVESRAGDGRDGSLQGELPKGITNGNQGHFMSKLFGRTSKDNPSSGNVVDGKIESHQSPNDTNISSLDEFMPEGGMAIDRSFLEDDSKHPPLPVPMSMQRDSDDEDSDAGKGNPLVAGFQDDLDSDYEYSGANHSGIVMASTPRDVNSSPALSDDDGEGERPLSVASGQEGDATKAVHEMNFVQHKSLSTKMMRMELLEPKKLEYKSDVWSKTSASNYDDLVDGFIKENNVSSDESVTIPSMEVKTQVSKEKVKKKKEKGDEKSSKKHKKTKKKKEKDGEGKSERRKKKSSHSEQSGRLASDELEEFLNGSPASVVPEAYEAI
ncbi:rab-like protein 6 isoform X2 [Ischnura elegans]|uniref:rab-like protein 6 isoform X2 n=1 Tax=Ischnura elegans TaxID=197161 RepID=UPI001ED8711D|nr:rab-like protein 6 isoform X2 [Ischnura elegans]